jgi:hypothetical protein
MTYTFICGYFSSSGSGLHPIQFSNVADIAWTMDQSKMVVVRVIFLHFFEDQQPLLFSFHDCK